MIYQDIGPGNHPGLLRNNLGDIAISRPNYITSRLVGCSGRPLDRDKLVIAFLFNVASESGKKAATSRRTPPRAGLGARRSAARQRGRCAHQRKGPAFRPQNHCVAGLAPGADEHREPIGGHALRGVRRLRLKHGPSHLA